MGLDPQMIIVALVVLHSTSGEVIDDHSVITAETIERFTPSEESASFIKEALSKQGFDVGQLSGISFSIVANVATFNQYFNVSIEQDEEDGYVIYRGHVKYVTFPLDQLPKKMTEGIHSIIFDQPVESFF